MSASLTLFSPPFAFRYDLRADPRTLLRGRLGKQLYPERRAPRPGGHGIEVVFSKPANKRAGASRAPALACEVHRTIALLSLLRPASAPPVSALLSACAPPVPLPLLGLV